MTMGNILVIDRIEEEWAVIEYRPMNTTFSIPAALLPEDAGEGDIIELDITMQKDEALKLRRELERFLKENMED